MLRQSISRSFSPNNLLTIVSWCSVGSLLGLASLLFSPLLVLGVLAAVVFMYFTLKRPEIGLLGILIATSSIVFEETLPMISVGISFHIPDILLLGLLGLIVVRWLFDPEFRIVRTPLDTPLLIFYGVTLLSTSIAIFQSSVEAEYARRALRVLSYYLTFFIVTNLVRDRRRLDFLLNSLFLLSTIVAAAMVAQFLVGESVQFLPGRVESLATQGAVFGDITRILPPGSSVVLVSFVTIVCLLGLEKFKPRGLVKFLQCGIMGMALLITFLRSYWAVLTMVFILLVFLFRGVDRKRLIGWAMVVIASAVMILLVLFNDPGSRASKLLDASMHRLSSLGGAVQGQDSSLNWRMIENRYAFSSIASHPLIGLGMGFTYRPWDSRLDQKDADGSIYDFRKHIHNGHLWILLQSGLLGYLSLMWLSLAFLIRGLKYWRRVADDRMRAIVLGFTLVYLSVLIAAWVNSTFMQWRWTPVIGIIMGINEVILMKYKTEVSAHY